MQKIKNFLKPTKVTFIAIVIILLSPLLLPLLALSFSTPNRFVTVISFLPMIVINSFILIPGYIGKFLGVPLVDDSGDFIAVPTAGGIIIDIIALYIFASFISWLWYRIKNGKDIKTDFVSSVE